MDLHWFWRAGAREPVDRLEARVLHVADRLEQATRELECLVSSLSAEPSEETKHAQPQRRR